MQSIQNDSADVSRTLWARGAKRVFDVLASVSLLVILSPVFILAAIIVKLTSRGPLLFSQLRCGRDAAIFRLYKFRTMLGGRTPDPKELVPLDHPEITPAGRFLRRFKIDELPQLVTVISGRMSLVGPRPTLPDQIKKYDAFRRQRLLVRPGITGLAQVNTNTSVAWDERILFDIAYVRRCSLLMDIGILLRTFGVLVTSERCMTRTIEFTPYGEFVQVPEGYRD